MSEPYPSRLLDRFVLRMPDGLRERLAEVAKANGRSMNAEMVLALEFWLSDRTQASTREPMSEDEVATIGEALGRAIASSPKLMKRFGVIDALVATGRFGPIATEDGRYLGPDDRLADVGEVEGGPSFPRRVDGDAVPIEERERIQREFDAGQERIRQREARKRKERA